MGLANRSLAVAALLEPTAKATKGGLRGRRRTRSCPTLVSLPAEVTREGVLAKDRRMLDLCWNALNLENAEWWREWKRDWQP